MCHALDIAECCQLNEAVLIPNIGGGEERERKSKDRGKRINSATPRNENCSTGNICMYCYNGQEMVMFTLHFLLNHSLCRERFRECQW